jgi:crossover junction endonuclease MUS81
MDGVIRHPTEVDGVDSLLSVNGIGPKIAEMVMDVMFDTPRRSEPRDVQHVTGAPQRKERSSRVQSKEYVPRLGSANYAFLIVLYRAQQGENARPHLTKAELMDLAEASGLSSKPIHSRGAGSARLHGSRASRTYYDGWSNFKALLNNGLVRAWGSPRKIALTETGAAVARRLAALVRTTDYDDGDDDDGDHTNDVSPRIGRWRNLDVAAAAAGPPDCSARAPHRSQQVVCNAAGQGVVTAHDSSQDSGMEIVLLMDSREQYARSIADQMPGVEVRLLPIGDALWVARPRRGGRGGADYGIAPTGSSPVTDLGTEKGKENGEEEYVLDFVIERKSIQDLLHSVREGSRYASQKYRLQQCGLRHLYYLVEGDVESLSSSADYKVVGTACAKTSAIDGFNVLRPKSFAETMAMLTRMTRSIRKRMGIDLDRSRVRSMGMMTFTEFRDRCVRLERDADCARDVWSVMLNEVPGVGRVGVERGILSDPLNRTCRGFYVSELGRADGDPARSSRRASSKVEKVWKTLFG